MEQARTDIRFVLDGRIRSVSGGAPSRTVLDYLRMEAGRCGTKEGCAEGDCGACTVVLGELTVDGLRYRAVNSCILFLPTLDGKELITVESVQHPDGTLHPVQQAMVDHHGSQCGFCTPGFVMSLYALWLSGARPSRAEVNETLAGNLCRCTGYRPIVDAALSIDAEPGPRDTSLLETIRPDGRLAFGTGPAHFYAPTDIAALGDLTRQHKDALLLAGGTDIGLWVTKLHRQLGTIIYLGNVETLRAICETEQYIEIGAAVPYSDAMALIARHFADLLPLFRRLGSVQIRNSGTIGGNIGNASPIGDSLPALMALDAELVLRSGAETRVVTLNAFFLGYRKTVLQPGEFIQTIRIPRPPLGTAIRAYKISKRADQDISAVCGAFSLVLKEDRVAQSRLCFGGVAAIPVRATACEQALLGQVWTQDAIEAALPALADAVTPISDMRASAAYRRQIAENLLRKFYLETSGTPVSLDLVEAAE